MYKKAHGTKQAIGCARTVFEGESVYTACERLPTLEVASTLTSHTCEDIPGSPFVLFPIVQKSHAERESLGMRLFRCYAHVP